MGMRLKLLEGAKGDRGSLKDDREALKADGEALKSDWRATLMVERRPNVLSMGDKEY